MLNKKKEILIKVEIGTIQDISDSKIEEQINQMILAAEMAGNKNAKLRWHMTRVGE